MGIEGTFDEYTGDGYSSAYYQSYAGPATRPAKPHSSRGNTYNQPIDLTDSPPRKRQIKRKADFEDDAVENGSAKKKKRCADEEKRLRRWRPKAPISYGEVRDRALTQRMFVLDRERQEPENGDAHPIETVTLAGTTGNIYHITVGKVPTCDCPHALKGNQCKHIVYVLSRVLRVPAHLEYQLAFITPELNDIFAKAPPLPSQTAKESAKDGNRKPIEGECPICCVDFEPENSKEEVVYCKASCGNNIHKHCFDQWAATKPRGKVTCPFCRTQWANQNEQDLKKYATNGEVNEEGYVNIAGKLGLSGERDYSSYNEFWVRNRHRSSQSRGWSGHGHEY